MATRYRKYAERKNKSWRQADALVRKNLLPKWAKLLAASITRADVKKLIASIDLLDVSASFALETIKSTTALPLHYAKTE